MKILCLPSDTAGCGFLRLIQPYTRLKDYGHQVRFVYAEQMLLHPGAIETDIDLYVFQLVADQQIVDFAKQLRQHRPEAKIIMDLDDHLRAIPKSNISYKNGWGEGRPATKALLNFIQLSDVLTVSTPDLAEEYKRFNPNIRVLYNSIEDREVDLKPEITGRPKRAGQIRIGYGASWTHLADFQMILKPLVKAMRDYPDTRMVFIGADFRKCLPRDLYARCEYAGSTWRNPGKPSTIAYWDLMRDSDLDFCIAPLESTTFNRSKSYLKAMEAGLIGVPIIGSRVGPYIQYVNECKAQPMLLAGSDREWTEHFVSLINFPDKRKASAEANRQYVEQSHRMSNRIGGWVEMLTGLTASVAA